MKRLILFFLLVIPLVSNAQMPIGARHLNVTGHTHRYHDEKRPPKSKDLTPMMPSPRNNGRFVKKYSDSYKKLWGIKPHSKYIEYDEHGNFVCIVVPTQQHVIKWYASNKIYENTCIIIDQVKYRGEDITYRVMYLQFEWYDTDDVLRYDLIHEKKMFMANERFKYLMRNKFTYPLKYVKVGYVGKDSRLHVIKYPPYYLYPNL